MNRLCLRFPRFRSSRQPRTLTLGAAAVVIAACAVLGGAGRGASATRLSAVVYERDGDLYAVAVDGSRTVRLTRTRVQEEYPAVSPDGTMVAFSREYPNSGAAVSRSSGSARRTRGC